MRQYGTPALLFAAAADVLGVLCSRIADWAAMTDELLYERLSLSFVDGDAVEEVNRDGVIKSTKYTRVINDGVALMLDRVADWLDDKAAAAGQHEGNKTHRDVPSP